MISFLFSFPPSAVSAVAIIDLENGGPNGIRTLREPDKYYPNSTKW
jgi:hypothetical protein